MTFNARRGCDRARERVRTCILRKSVSGLASEKLRPRAEEWIVVWDGIDFQLPNSASPVAAPLEWLSDVCVNEANSESPEEKGVAT